MATLANQIQSSCSRLADLRDHGQSAGARLCRTNPIPADRRTVPLRWGYCRPIQPPENPGDQLCRAGARGGLLLVLTLLSAKSQWPFYAVLVLLGSARAFGQHGGPIFPAANS